MPSTVADVLATLRNDVRNIALNYNKTSKPLVRSGPALLNIFVTVGHATPQEKRAAIELAEENTRYCKEIFKVSDCKTVWQNYSSDVRDYSSENAIYKTGQGKPPKVNFNVQQHPDEACKLILKVSLHVHHVLPNTHLAFAEAVTHGHLGRSHNSIDLSKWMKNQEKHSHEKMFALVIPCVKFLVVNCGGPEAFVDAGYHGRLAMWYDHFDEFAYVISKVAFEFTGEIWNLDALHGGGADDPSGLAAKCRARDRYVFGESCEEAFFFLIDGETKLSKKVMKLAWRTMTMKTKGSFMEELALPDWRDLPAKIFLEDGMNISSIKVPSPPGKHKLQLKKSKTSMKLTTRAKYT